MPGQCCAGKPTSKRLCVGGQQVGISGYDEVMEIALNSLDSSDKEQKAILLRELKARNYVPDSLVAEYLGAIWEDFRQLRARKKGQIEERFHGIPREEILWFPTIDYEICNSCGKCFKFCQKGVYTFDDKPVVENPYRCVVSCTGCASQCTEKAISFPSFLELRDTMKELRKKYNIISE